MTVLDPVVSGLQVAALAVYVTAQALLVAYSSHRYVTLWRWWRGGARRGRRPSVSHGAWPRVTVQLPVYNERRVVRRLVEAAGRLDYPRDRLEIQVLDDSTDETTAEAATAVDALRRNGIDAILVHREARNGFKAGALADGLGRARGELVAVFDADFVPRPDFLKRLVPHFSDPRVGMVQARWGHLNRNRSLLTRAQAVMLDSHFLLEHAVRSSDGLYFNFNGTAGVWRRRCIEEAGGWSHDTLTEDLDLSYRAQMAGWRFVFDPGVEAPAELPGNMEALKSQQRRWAKGSMQTAVKILPRLLREAVPRRLKIEAFFHLTSNVTYPLLLLLGLLLAPVLVGNRSAPGAIVWGLQLGVIAFGVVPVSAFLVAGQRLAGVRGWALVRDVGAALILGIGLSVNNSRAVIEGLGPRLGPWERTPKTGDGAAAGAFAPYAPAAGGRGSVEWLLAFYFAGLALFAGSMADYRALPFIGLLIAGFSIVAWGSLPRRCADRLSI